MGDTPISEKLVTFF